MKTTITYWTQLLSFIAALAMAPTVLALQRSPQVETPVAAEATNAVSAADTKPEEPEQQAKPEESITQEGRRWTRPQRDALVVLGKNGELKAGESAEAVVVVGGSATVGGRVREAVVAVGGDILLKQGAEASDVIAVLGNIKVEKGVKVDGEAISIGGKVEAEEGAQITGQIHDVDIGGLVLPKVEWLRDWFRYCVLMVRPLAPQVGWVWIIAGVFFLFYVLVAALFPHPVQACVDQLNRKPATTFFLGLLAKLLVPLVIALLSITMVGLVVVPFIVAALILGAIVGKVAILEWIGFRLGKPFEAPVLQKPLVALLIGSAIICLLYMVPFFGLLVFMILSLWGFGSAVAAAFTGLKREAPARLAYVAPAAAPAFETAAAGTPVQPFYAPQPQFAGAAAAAADATTPGSAFSSPGIPDPPPLSAPTSPPVLPEVLSYPRAGFWERLGAGFIDLVLMVILGRIVGGPPLAFLVALAYFAGMWAWRGTTIGGIVLGLKVVRTDGAPLTFPVALVRGLAGAFSLIVLFLGFFWIAWDREKQGWHDKLAGTVVLRQPRLAPLLCL